MQIEQATEEWAYPQMQRNYYGGIAAWVEVSEEFYFEAMGAVPPIHVHDGFMVSEPMDHDDLSGLPVYAAFVEREGRYFARYATAGTYRYAYRELEEALAAVGVV